jgi:hypothetical protein
MPVDKPLNIFISYSNNETDRSQLNALVTMLRPLEDNKTIKIWDDSHILAGELWDDEIKENLNLADIVLLLLSPNFLASRYINETELTIIFDRRDNQECKVIPILLRNCLWEVDKRISKAAILPKDKNSRKLMQIAEWEREGDAFFDISNELNALISNIQNGIEILQPKSVAKPAADSFKSWATFFSNQRMKKFDEIAPLMSVNSNRETHYKNQLRQHFKKHKDRQENLVYLISACPKQKPASIAKRLVYFFEDEFTDYIRHEKYQNEMRTIDLQLKSTESGTWKVFWQTFQREFLKAEEEEEKFFANPFSWLEKQKRVALAFQIEENVWTDVVEVHEHLQFILTKFDALPSKYRKFVFFFVLNFPDLHSHRSEACQCHLECLDSITISDGVTPDEFHKLHVHRLDVVSEGDVKVWANSILESPSVDLLLAELRKRHPNNPLKNGQIHYDMQILEEMQHEVYAYLRDNYNK